MTGLKVILKWLLPKNTSHIHGFYISVRMIYYVYIKIVIYLAQWISSSGVCWNHPEGVLKTTNC